MALTSWTIQISEDGQSLIITLPVQPHEDDEGKFIVAEAKGPISDSISWDGAPLAISCEVHVRKGSKGLEENTPGTQEAQEERQPADQQDIWAISTPNKLAAKTVNLTWEQELALVRTIQNPCSRHDYEQARETLIQAMHTWIVSIARRFANRGLPLEDLIQEGKIGLLRAVEKCDPNLNYRFSHYAIWWIRQAIARAVANQGRLIRLPVHVMDMLEQINKTWDTLCERLGRPPTEHEIAEELGLTEEKVRSILDLEDPFSEEGENHLADLIPSPDTCDLVEQITRKDIRAALLEALKKLSSRERFVIVRRYGLDGGGPRTLEEVGREINLTRERVRQIESDALAKLRTPRCSRYLRACLEW